MSFFRSRSRGPFDKVPTDKCPRCDAHGYVCDRCKSSVLDCECEGETDVEPCWWCEPKKEEKKDG